VGDDPNLANQIYKFAIDLETNPKFPEQELDSLNDKVDGRSKKAEKKQEKKKQEKQRRRKTTNGAAKAAEEIAVKPVEVAKAPEEPAVYNNIAHTVIRALVVDYLHLNRVPRPQAQALCQRLNIKVPADVVDPTMKRLPPSKPS
jgi:hypothetical protein